MTSRSRSRDQAVGSGRSRTRSRSPSDRGRSPVPRSISSRSPSPDRRRDYDRDSRSHSQSRGYRSRSYSRDRSYDSRSLSRSNSSRSLGPLDTGSTKIIVERLTKNVNENHLREIFGRYGDIEDLELPMNRQAGTNRGTAYILYYRREDAEMAIAHTHGGKIDGAVIDVSIVLPRRILVDDSRNAPLNSRVPHPGDPVDSRRSPGPGNGSNRYGERSDTYRPRSISRSRSRSRSPNRLGSAGRRYRSRSYSYPSARSRSPSLGRGGRGGRGGRSGQAYDNGDRRRSPSSGSYESYRRRSRSHSRDWDRR